MMRPLHCEAAPSSPRGDVDGASPGDDDITLVEEVVEEVVPVVPTPSPAPPKHHECRDERVAVLGHLLWKRLEVIRAREAHRYVTLQTFLEKSLAMGLAWMTSQTALEIAQCIAVGEFEEITTTAKLEQKVGYSIGITIVMPCTAWLLRDATKGTTLFRDVLKLIAFSSTTLIAWASRDLVAAFLPFMKDVNPELEGNWGTLLVAVVLTIVVCIVSTLPVVRRAQENVAAGGKKDTLCSRYVALPSSSTLAVAYAWNQAIVFLQVRVLDRIATKRIVLRFVVVFVRYILTSITVSILTAAWYWRRERLQKKHQNKEDGKTGQESGKGHESDKRHEGNSGHGSNEGHNGKGENHGHDDEHGHDKHHSHDGHDGHDGHDDHGHHGHHGHRGHHGHNGLHHNSVRALLQREQVIRRVKDAELVRAELEKSTGTLLVGLLGYILGWALNDLMRSFFFTLLLGCDSAVCKFQQHLAFSIVVSIVLSVALVRLRTAEETTQVKKAYQAQLMNSITLNVAWAWMGFVNKILEALSVGDLDGASNVTRAIVYPIMLVSFYCVAGFFFHEMLTMVRDSEKRRKEEEQEEKEFLKR